MPTQPPRPPVSRRAVLGAVSAALVVSGCAADDQGDRDRPSSQGTLAPDVAVATTALAAIRRVHAGVEAAADRFPPLRRRLAPLGSMHRAHERSLTDAVPEHAPGPPDAEPLDMPARRPLAERRLREAEQELHDQLRRLALRAESGPFARLLASMGAAIVQQLEDWPA